MNDNECDITRSCHMDQWDLSLKGSEEIKKSYKVMIAQKIMDTTRSKKRRAIGNTSCEVVNGPFNVVSQLKIRVSGEPLRLSE